KVTWKPSELMAVAKSQVGYREPSYRNNKYNDWINGNNAWCQVYVAWVFEKAGYPEYVPKEKAFSNAFLKADDVGKYSTYVGKLNSAGVLDQNVSLGDLKQGYVALIDWGGGHGTSHTGIVDRVDGNGAWFYEGNTTAGNGNPAPGVFHRWRPLSYIKAVYDPRDYYDATH
uniref:CHAP domain-containing protein n=1 Tax=Demequina aurantiaca TaxID=676200 RepID=UPI000B038D04